jgi:anaerobic magnesium-protoporphyrin IX monomethyl ester cyclase
MKVLLVNPSSAIWNAPKQVPLGLAYLAATLEKEGHKVKILDMNINKDLFPELKRDPDVVGFTATTPTIKTVWHLAEQVKKAAPALVAVGGPHPSALPFESIEKCGVDVVVVGEGDETFKEICALTEAKKSLVGVKGCVCKENGQIIDNGTRSLIKDVDSLPFPAFHLFDLEKYGNAQPIRDYKKGARSFYIFTSRGCPYSCLFCSKSLYGRTFRPRSPENVLEEWRILVDDYKATEIGMQDDIFNFHKPRALKICSMIKKEGLDVPWITCNGIRTNHTDAELLSAMKQAGCYRVGYGVESGNQQVLNFLQKAQTLQMVEDAFKATKKVGLESMGFFMIGNPAETEETIDQTIDFAIKLDPTVAHFTISSPFPGTQTRKLVEANGKLLITDWDNYGILEGKAFFEFGELTAKIVEAKWHQAYRRFYLRPRRVAGELVKLNNWRNLPMITKSSVRFFVKGSEEKENMITAK